MFIKCEEDVSKTNAWIRLCCLVALYTQQYSENKESSYKEKEWYLYATTFQCIPLYLQCWMSWTELKDRRDTLRCTDNDVQNS